MRQRQSRVPAHVIGAEDDCYFGLPDRSGCFVPDLGIDSPPSVIVDVGTDQAPYLILGHLCRRLGFIYGIEIPAHGLRQSLGVVRIALTRQDRRTKRRRAEISERRSVGLGEALVVQQQGLVELRQNALQSRGTKLNSGPDREGCSQASLVTSTVTQLHQGGQGKRKVDRSIGQPQRVAQKDTLLATLLDKMDLEFSKFGLQALPPLSCLYATGCRYGTTTLAKNQSPLDVSRAVHYNSMCTGVWRRWKRAAFGTPRS